MKTESYKITVSGDLSLTFCIDVVTDDGVTDGFLRDFKGDDVAHFQELLNMDIFDEMLIFNLCEYGEESFNTVVCKGNSDRSPIITWKETYEKSDGKIITEFSMDKKFN